LAVRGSTWVQTGVFVESQVITVCQDIADSLDNGDKIDAIIVDFSKAFDSVPHGRLLTKIANSGVNSKVVGWIREFVLGRTTRDRVGRQLSEKVRINSRLTQGSVLGAILFLAYVNDIWRNMVSTSRLFADDCLIYRKITYNADMEKFQNILERLGIGRLKMR